jgi:XTP/dITP diphosphohydrolase
MIPGRLVLATANPGKIAELRALVGEWGHVEMQGLDTLGGVVLPREGEASYAENAIAKALAVALASGLPALGDDSGLEVDALDGGPGVLSARLAASDGERIATLLARLANAGDRRARFRCVVALAWPDGRVETAEGTCAGVIVEAPVGRGGFGYDPVFLANELGHTFAEATAAEKARVSHRARAVRALGRHLASRGSAALRHPRGTC